MQAMRLHHNEPASCDLRVWGKSLGWQISSSMIHRVLCSGRIPQRNSCSQEFHQWSRCNSWHWVIDLILCYQAVSVGQSVSESGNTSHYRLNQTQDFDETWPQASYLMPNEGVLTTSKFVLIKGVYGGGVLTPQNRYLLSSPKQHTQFR